VTVQRRGATVGKGAARAPPGAASAGSAPAEQGRGGRRDMEGGVGFLNAGEDMPRRGRGRGLAAARRRWLGPARRSGGTGDRCRWGRAA
jgi:hypothetical protein